MVRVRVRVKVRVRVRVRVLHNPKADAVSIAAQPRAISISAPMEPTAREAPP